MDIKERFGKAHQLRAGIEVKPLPELAIRGGYVMNTSAEHLDVWGEPLGTLMTHTASFGLGYSSKGSFFADAAVQTRFMHDEYFMPYDDYIFDSDGYVVEFAPMIRNHRSLWKAVLTIGFRF